MIRFDHVSKHFRRGGDVIRALDDVSFEVPAGALATVRGPSGSGKTTLINMAAALMHPSAGAITVSDKRVDTLSNREQTVFRSSNVAVVFQMFHLVPYLTAFENVLLPTLARKDGAFDPAERASRLLEEVGLEKRSSHYPDELSAGERQRCALARALLNRPRVILADEPTGNLDPESALHVLKALDNCRREGTTVLLVTHQPVETLAPDVELRLRLGKLAE